MRRINILITIALLQTACSVDQPTPPEARRAGSVALTLSDARHNNGNQHFFFLPPLVADPHPTGTFDPTLHPVVEVCEWNAGCIAVVARFTMETGELRLDASSEQYIVNWDTKKCLTGPCSLDPAKVYRIRISAAGVDLGFADVDVVASGSQLKNVETSEYIALLDGRTLPIKFRIEVGAVSVVGPAGGTLTFLDGCVRLAVPAGALLSEIGVALDAAPSPQGTTAARLVAGSVLRIGPPGTTFALPATLSQCYDASAIPAGRTESSLRLYEHPADTWEFLTGGSVNTTTRIVSAPISRAGLYSVQSMRRVGMSTYSETASRWQIYFVYEDGSDLHLFLDNARSPTWSPDGTRIAFTHIEPSGTDSRPMVISLASNATVDLAGQNIQGVNATGYSWPMAWSPDGTKITLMTDGGVGTPAGPGAFTNQYRWTVLAADGSTAGNILWPVHPSVPPLSSLPDDYTSGCCAEWSLDGSFLYANFNGWVAGPALNFTGLYRINPDLATGLQVLKAQCCSPQFDNRGLTADGNHMVVLYQDLVGWNSDLPYSAGVMDLSTTNITRILPFIDASDNGYADGGLRDGSISLLPDRAHISFFALGIHSVTHADGCVWTASLAGTGLRCVFDGSALRSLDPGLVLVPIEGWEP